MEKSNPSAKLVLSLPGSPAPPLPWNAFAHRECPFIVSERYWLFKNTMEALYPRCLRHEGPVSLARVLAEKLT